MFSVLCIGINAIVGSGIYRLPGRIAHDLGPASWLAFLVVGLLLVTVALCFAEAGGMFDANGGPYVYAREAFGKPVAFGVGWMAYVTMVFSWAAVANAVIGYLEAVVPLNDSPLVTRAVVAALILGPGALNYFGVRPGAYATNFFTVAKLLPLSIFVLVGIWFVDWHHVTAMPDTGGRGFAPVGAALFAALFAVQGFEVAPIPAGEAANPKKAVPIAVIGALVGCSVFYVLIQLVAFGTKPTIGMPPEGSDALWSARPIAEAAETFMGSAGGLLMAAGACISMMGFCVGSALATPRFLSVFAEDNIFPHWFAKPHPRYGSPDRAIVTTTALTLVASQVLDFDKLVDLANVAVTLQYVGTCAAVAWLRVKRPELARTYRVPLGPYLIPALGLGVCVLFFSQASITEFLFSGLAVVAGTIIAVGTWLVRRGVANRAV